MARDRLVDWLRSIAILNDETASSSHTQWQMGDERTSKHGDSVMRGICDSRTNQFRAAN